MGRKACLILTNVLVMLSNLFKLVIATGTNQQPKKKKNNFIHRRKHSTYNTYYVYLTTKGGMLRTLSTFHWDIKLLKAPCDRPYVHFKRLL